MQQISNLLGIFYRLVVIILAVYGIHNLVLTIIFLLKKKNFHSDQPVPAIEEWPQVTIQLPIFNEKYTLERLLRTMTQLEYPTERLQIQVLDDSTDDTATLARLLVEMHKASGVNIEYLHRSNRQGYKAGAMKEALQSATGEFIGIFDADFLPEPDWLKKTIPYFQDPELGCLQTRWGHTNRNYSLLTQAEALIIDGHFVVEQTVRSNSELFLNFNGTAGLWRRACIEDAGGWQWDTMTEDLDLSYRAQMRGWKIRYRPEVVVPGELPSTVEAFKQQQSRWARGSFQSVRKLLPQILKRADIPGYVRLAASLHITGYIVSPLVLFLLLLTLPVGLLAPDAFKALPISLLACVGPPLMYLVTNSALKRSWLERLKMIPLLVVVGFGISLSVALGVLKGLTGKTVGDWDVTPKLNLNDTSSQKGRRKPKSTKPISPIVWGEVLLACYALTTILVLKPVYGWGIVPWMALYVVGFLYIAGLNISEQRPGAFEKIKNTQKDEMQSFYPNKNSSENHTLGETLPVEEGWSYFRIETQSKSYLKSIEEIGGENRVY